MQIECRKSSSLELYAEMQLIVCKGNANQRDNKMYQDPIFHPDRAYCMEKV